MCRCGAKQDDRPGRKNRLGKKVIAKVIPAFPLSKIAHWSILLRGNGWSPNYCRSGGTDPILSTQRIPRGQDLIFSTQRMPRRRELIFSTHTFSGPLWDFVNEKRRLYIEITLILRSQKLRIPRWGDRRGAMRQKMAIFKEGNSVCRGTNFSGMGKS